MNYLYKNRRRKLIFISFFVVLIAFFLAAGTSLAQSGTQQALEGLNQTADTGFGSGYAASQTGTLSARIGKFIGNLLAFIGLLFFILMIYGGFTWMTAGGNEEKVRKALGTIVQSVIGMIIIAAAYLITRFVGETIIGAFVK